MAQVIARSTHRSKVLAAWLAFLFGVVGAHWWYMGRRHAWMVTAFSVLMILLAQGYPVWWDNPFFLLLSIPITEGFIEALVFALRSDEAFDTRYNAGSDTITRTGWNAVLVAIVTTAVGGVVVCVMLALIVMHIWTAMGWLDGYQF